MHMKRDRISIPIIMISLILFLNSCILNILCVDGNGLTGTDNRDDHDFTAIINSTDADIIYKKGDSYSVSVEADENLLKYYSTSVTHNSIKIEIEGANCVRSVTPAVIRITAPMISAITLSGSGNIVADTISGTETRIINSGSGDITIHSAESVVTVNRLSGSGDITIDNLYSDEITILITGSGDMTTEGSGETGIFTSTGSGQNYSGNLELNNCTALISGSGDIYTSVSDEIHATLTGSGNLYYRGSPQIFQTTSGSGRIIHIQK